MHNERGIYICVKIHDLVLCVTFYRPSSIDSIACFLTFSNRRLFNSKWVILVSEYLVYTSIG